MKTHHITAAIAAFTILATTIRAEAQVVQTTMPDEAARHEGTWLQWPHHYTYGASYPDFPVISAKHPINA